MPVPNVEVTGLEWSKATGRPPLTPLAVFRQAEAYHVGANVIATANRGLNLAYVSMNLDCVSVELYLKAMLLEQNGVIQQGHDLLKLFKNLRISARKGLEDAWASYFPTSPYFQLPAEYRAHIDWPPSFADALRMASKVQQQARYLWEDMPDATFLLAEGPSILRDYILKEHPGWNT